MKKKFGLLALVALLASCGGNSGTKEKTYWKDTGHLTFDDDGNVIFEDVEITIRTICNSIDANKVEALVSSFNRLNTGITVNFTKDGQGSYYNNLGRMISNDLDTVPELCMFHNERIASLQKSHFFQPIDRLFEKMNVESGIEDFNENTVSNNYVDGALYGLPIDAHSEVILYRKDLLAKYNLEVPTTYNEFVAASKTIQAGERATNPNFYAAAIPTGAFGISQYAFNTAIFQNGGSIIDSQSYPNWDSDPAVKTALTKMHDLYYGENKIAKPDSEDSYSDEAFVRGDVAFSFVYTWNMNNDLFARYGSTYMDSNEWGVMNMEGLFANDSASAHAKEQFAISHSFFIPRTIKDITKKAAALTFAKWYSTTAAADWSEAGHVPQSKSVLSSSAYTSKDITNKVTKNFGDPTHFRNFPKTEFYSEVADSLQALFVEALNEANPNYDALIKSWNKSAKDKILASLD